MPANGSLAGLSERLRDMQPDDVIAWPLVGPNADTATTWSSAIRAATAKAAGEFTTSAMTAVTDKYEVVRCMLIRRTA